MDNKMLARYLFINLSKLLSFVLVPSPTLLPTFVFGLYHQLIPNSPKYSLTKLYQTAYNYNSSFLQSYPMYIFTNSRSYFSGYSVGSHLESLCVWILWSVFFIHYGCIGLNSKINSIREMDLNTNRYPLNTISKLITKKMNFREWNYSYTCTYMHIYHYFIKYYNSLNL